MRWVDDIKRMARLIWIQVMANRIRWKLELEEAKMDVKAKRRRRSFGMEFFWGEGAGGGAPLLPTR